MLCLTCVTIGVSWATRLAQPSQSSSNCYEMMTSQEDLEKRRIRSPEGPAQKPAHTGEKLVCHLALLPRSLINLMQFTAIFGRRMVRDTSGSRGDRRVLTVLTVE